MKRIAHLFFIALIAISCDDEPEEKPVTFFEMDVHDTYNSSYTDDWAILHDKDGQVLSVKFFESGDHIAFDSMVVPEKMGVTIISVSSSYFIVNTYLEQNPMTKWTLKEDVLVESNASHVGVLKVKVSDPDLGSSYDSEISDKFGRTLTPRVGGPDIVFPDQIATTENKFLIFVTDKNGNPFYKLLDQGLTGDHTYTLQNFTAFEETIAFNFPERATYFAIVRAFESGNDYPYRGYRANLYWDGHFSGIPKSSLNLGFTGHFPLYQIEAAVSYENYALCYNYFGPPLTTDITLTNDITASVTNKTFADHAISGSDYLWFKSFWRAKNDSGVEVGYLTVHGSANGNKNLQSIPVQITNKYPFVGAAYLEYANTHLYNGPQTYETFIAEKFKEELEQNSYESKFKSVF